MQHRDPSHVSTVVLDCGERWENCALSHEAFTVVVVVVVVSVGVVNARRTVPVLTPSEHVARGTMQGISVKRRHSVVRVVSRLVISPSIALSVHTS